MVKLKRHKSITVEYLDEKGNEHVMSNLEMAVSELLQHEYDHL